LVTYRVESSSTINAKSYNPLLFAGLALQSSTAKICSCKGQQGPGKIENGDERQAIADSVEGRSTRVERGSTRPEGVLRQPVADIVESY